MDKLAVQQLLQAADEIVDPRYLGLLHALESLHRNADAPRNDAPMLSIKLRPGELERGRYEAVIHTNAMDAPLFLRSVTKSAPSDAVADLLSQPQNYVAKWIRESGRSVSYLAVAFEARIYKLYLLDIIDPTFLEGRNLWYLLPQLYRACYIDCLEIDLDNPQRYRRPVYFKLRVSNMAALFDPGYRPHPQIENRLLREIPTSASVTEALTGLTSGLQRGRDPIIKLHYVAGEGSERDEVEQFCRSDYSISVDTFDSSCLKHVNDCYSDILDLADAFDCRIAVTHWLDAIHPFNCTINRLGVGSDTLTIYYKVGESPA